jgi:hypothetical protein
MSKTEYAHAMATAFYYGSLEVSASTWATSALPQPTISTQQRTCLYLGTKMRWQKVAHQKLLEVCSPEAVWARSRNLAMDERRREQTEPTRPGVTSTGWAHCFPRSGHGCVAVPLLLFLVQVQEWADC